MIQTTFWKETVVSDRRETIKKKCKATHRESADADDEDVHHESTKKNKRRNVECGRTAEQYLIHVKRWCEETATGEGG